MKIQTLYELSHAGNVNMTSKTENELRKFARSWECRVKTNIKLSLQTEIILKQKINKNTNLMENNKSVHII
jgi:hypothetical protein